MLEILIVLAFQLKYVTYGNNWNCILILSFYYISSSFTHDFYCIIVMYKKPYESSCEVEFDIAYLCNL